MGLTHWLDGVRLHFSQPGRRRTRARKLASQPAAQISSESLERRVLLTTTYINAGGPTLVGDMVFEEDDAYQNGVGRSFRRRKDIDMSQVDADLPEEVFKSVLWDRRRRPELQFDIPVESGKEYEVDLLFSEIRRGRFREGARIFDVAIEGDVVLDDFDIFAEVGARTALTKTFTVNATDDNLDIDLAHVKNHPAIAGIIVRSLDDDDPGTPTDDNEAPVLDAISDRTVTRNTPLELTASATDPDGDAITYSIDTAGLPGSPSISPTLGVFTWTPPTAGTFDVTVHASDGELSDTDTFSVTVTNPAGQNQPPVLAPIARQQATVGSPLSFTVSATDTDAGDTISYAISPGAPSGMAINSNTGVVSWTPTAGQMGTFSIPVSASDGMATTSGNVVISVTNADPDNSAPSFSPLNDVSIDQNETLTVTPMAFDPDVNNTLTFSLVTGGLAGNPSVNPQSGQLIWTPPQAGTFPITLQVTDQGGLSDTVTFTVTVTASNVPNNAPVLGTIGNRQVAVGDTLTFTASATDADTGDTLQYYLNAGAPAGAAINPVTGVFTWAPTITDAGTASIVVNVTDGTDTDSETIQVTVSANNSAPTIAPISDRSVDVGTELQLTVSATDPDPGDTLTYSIVTTGLPGTPQIDPSSGVFTWTPTEADGPGFQLMVRVTDAGGLTDTEEFFVTVTEVNNANTPPVLNPIGTQTATVGQVLTFTASATDSDEPADTLTYFLDPTAPAGASIHGSTGVFTWTPSAEGTVTFPVLVSDGTVSVNQNVTVNVGPAAANQAPQFGSISNQTTVVNQQLQFNLPATDPENDNLTFSLVTTDLPGNPQVDSVTGQFTWTPTQASPGFNVTVRVTDPGGLSDTATFTVTVNEDNSGGNTPPTITPIPNQQATVGTQLSFTVTATDPDAGTTLTYFIDPTAPNGASIDSTTGAFTWTPVSNDAGTVTFPIFVGDGTVNVSTQVTIVVTDSGNGGNNIAPSFGPQNDRSIAAGQTLTVTFTAIDDNPGDTLTYSLVSTDLPGSPSIDPTSGQLTWTPPESAAGQSFGVTVRATDGGGLSDTTTMTVNVLSAGSGNQAPTIDPVPNQQATVGTQLTFTVSATDADGDTLEYFLDPTGPFGADINSSTGVFTWTPGNSDVGTTTFPIFVDDGTTNRSVNVTIVVSESSGGDQNTSPSMAPIDNQTVNEGELLSVTPVVDDPDQGEVLTFELLTTTLPGDAAVNAQTGEFTWTPPNDAGPQSYAVSIRVTDSAGASSTGSFSVQVNDAQ